MEEILASIRRIIAEDGESATTATPAGAAAAPPVIAAGPPPREPVLDPPDEILELTEMVESDGTVVSIADAQAEEPTPDAESAPTP
ncbi:MAG: DUF2497 domain-containing protein, partial [Alphaproteobacteria bacterium]|nr:DUF2497 domain-containing protein [Alphaproteobacteria bacterium]